MAKSSEGPHRRLPVVDLVRVDPEFSRQLGDGAVAPDCRQRHLRLERRVVLVPCPLHVLLPRSPRLLGAALHLSHLSHFRGPAHFDAEARREHNTATDFSTRTYELIRQIEPLVFSALAAMLVRPNSSYLHYAETLAVHSN